MTKRIRGSAKYISSMLTNVLTNSDDSAREDMRDLIEFNTLPDLNDKSGNNVMENYISMLDSMNIDEIHTLAYLWKRFVINSKNWEGMANAATATYMATVSNAYKINLEQKGLVCVGNFHNILVDVSIYLPRNRFFLKYVTIEKVDQEINVQQSGLVCVYTIDNVEVDLSVSVDLGIETAGIEYAMSRMKRLQDE